MTTKERTYLSRINCQFQGKTGQIVLDQIRTVDKLRLMKKLGTLDISTQRGVLTILAENIRTIPLANRALLSWQI